MTTAEAIQQAQGVLQAAGIADARREAEILIAACLNSDRAQLIAHPDAQLSPVQQRRLSCWLRRRAKREPLAYITRQAWFYGLELTVGRGALIPRPETELVVELFLEWTAQCVCCETPVMVDAGTGTGAIAVACLKNAPNWRGMAMDYSRCALQIAQRNRRKHELEARLLLVHSDWLIALRPKSVQAVLSNPPYVLPDEWDALQPEITRYEPRDALLVPADDPLQPYRQIAVDARRALRSPGLIALETSPRLTSAVAECLVQHGFASPQIYSDYSGAGRVVSATV